jgi:hypothetical protein
MFPVFTCVFVVGFVCLLMMYIFSKYSGECVECELSPHPQPQNWVVSDGVEQKNKI